MTTNQKNLLAAPLILRVRSNGELDKLMRSLLTTDHPLSAKELRNIGGLRRSAGLVRRLDQWFDNVKVVVERGDPEKKAKLSYVDIAPRPPEAIGTEVPSLDNSEDEVVSNIHWPQAPPMIESLGDIFREPTWFKTMKKMVDLGRHIALSGPPGVGKDTAVQELAATEGKVLVTVSGDAGFRRRDLVGSVNIRNGKSFMEVAEYAAAVVNGWWVLLTEVNAADADALMFINAQLAPPYVINIAGKSYPVHPDFRLFVSYNPGLIGTKPLPQSFKDRFFPIQIPFFSAYQLKSLLMAHGMLENSWSGFLVQFAMDMWSAHERGQLRYQVTSRRMMDVVALMNAGICDDVKQAIYQGAICAIDSPIEQKTASTILNQVHMEVANGSQL